MERLLNNRYTEYAITGMLILGVILIFFTPMVSILKKLSHFSVHIMLIYLMAGMFFFLYDQKRLVVVSMLCTAAICLFLKNASNQDIRLPMENAGPKLRVALLDLSAAEDGYGKTLDHILDLNADLVSVQELTPNWVPALHDSLCQMYPYQLSVPRIDPYGMGVYSRLPFEQVDTFYFGRIPNLRTSISIGPDLSVHLIHSISRAPVNEMAYSDIRDHFREVMRYSAPLEGELITMGNYHLPSWSPEIQEFKALSGLKDSRRDGLPRRSVGLATFFGVPVDHIFFSEGLECTDFSSVFNESSSHLGITGCYQLRTKGSEL